jgi:hypothetical protein
VQINQKSIAKNENTEPTGVGNEPQILLIESNNIKYIR